MIAHRPDAKAKRHDNDIYIEGVLFVKLFAKTIMHGYSRECGTCHYTRNLSWVSKLSEAEAVTRLRNWEAACPGDPDDHKKLGLLTPMLANYA